MKKTLSCLLLNAVFIAPSVEAHEPLNLAIAKQHVKQYHDSGAYKNDTANVMQKALRYLELRLKQGNFHGQKPALVLDIDETALSNYPDLVKRDFGGSLKDIRQDEDQGSDKAIEPTLKLYRLAKANKVAVFFITGRFEEERAITIKNLKEAGFVDYDGLILRNQEFRHASAIRYKKAARKSLTNKGYDIILNMGDQYSDLRGGYADKTFKLPNPYYFIP